MNWLPLSIYTTSGEAVAAWSGNNVAIVDSQRTTIRLSRSTCTEVRARPVNLACGDPIIQIEVQTDQRSHIRHVPPAVMQSAIRHLRQ